MIASRPLCIHSTNTLLAKSHFSQSVWTDFIRDTFYGETLDASAEKYVFSHQTAFNMRHKVLMALQDLLENNPGLLSGIAEFDEIFVLDCYKGSSVPPEAGRNARKHGAKVAKRGILSEYITISTGIQRDGGTIAATVNRTKPSREELQKIFRGHIAENTLALTDGLRSYYALETLTTYSAVNVNSQKSEGINLNTVNSLHSYIKDAYDHYRRVATKYLNRYNALFSMAIR